MTYKVKMITNAFDSSFLLEVRKTIMSGIKELGGLRCNYIDWDAGLVESSAPVLTFAIGGDVEVALLNAVKPYIPEIDEVKSTTFVYNMWTRNSYIPWHTDGDSYVFGATVYMNETWNPNWGGYFAYHKENENEISCIKPEFNSMVVIKPPVQHAVFSVNPNAPIRETIQIFGNL